MKLITIENKIIRLNSGLDEFNFAKTKSLASLNGTGITAVSKLNSDNVPVFEFSEWHFTDVKTIKTDEGKELVHFCGNSDLISDKAETLTDVFESDYKKACNFSYYICCAYSQALNNDIELPLTGGGIICDFSDDSVILIFPPKDIYTNAVSAFKPEDFSKYLGFWQNPTLTGKASLVFMRAVTAYKMLTDKYPFTEIQEIQRNADIYDNKFLPVDLCINGINPQLAEKINSGLKLTTEAPDASVKNLHSDFPCLALNEDPDNSKLSEEAFNKKVSDYLKSQTSKVRRKRNLRKNSTKLGVLGAIAAIFIFAVISTINSKAENYTSAGLTSSQTIEGFFQCFNNKDINTLSIFSKGKQFNSYVNAISNIYVVSQTNKAYSHGNLFTTMQNWLFCTTTPEQDENSSLYSIVNLTIDGKPSNLDVKLFRKNEKPDPVTEEKGIQLTKGIESVHNVEYYLAQSEGENNAFIIEKITATITLTYVKNRWILTNLVSESKDLNVDSNSFKMEYYSILEQTNNDVLEAVNILRKKYNWLPSKTVMENEQTRLKTQLLF